MSIAIGWAPTALWGPDAVAKKAPMTLSRYEGPPGTSVEVSLPGCTGRSPDPQDTPDDSPSPSDDSPSPSDDSPSPSEEGEDPYEPPAAWNAAAGLRAAGITAITWGPGKEHVGSGNTFVVPDADPGEYDVYATCSVKGVYGEAKFTVTPTHEPRQDITLTPGSGPSETNVTVDGFGFDCSAVRVSWDDGSTLVAGVTPSGGDISAKFDVPQDAPKGKHTVRAACTDPDRYYADADFTVTETGTKDPTTGDQNNGGTEDGGTEDGGTEDGGTEDGGTENGGTTGDTGGGTDGGTDSGGVGGTDGDGGGTTIPVGWVVGPSAFAALLLLAFLFSLMNHRQRGPRWVRDHIRTALRSGSGTAELRERREGGPANRTVRLEPHPDPGDQRFH